MGIHIDTCQGGSPHISSFLWADNYWMMSHSKTHLEQLMWELIDEAEIWDLEPKAASLWWSSTCADEKGEDITLRTRKGVQKFLFEKKKFRILGTYLQSRSEIHESFEEIYGECEQCLEERREDLQKRRCTVSKRPRSRSK